MVIFLLFTLCSSLLSAAPIETGIPLGVHCLPKEPDIYVSASYTFWTAREGGLAGALANITTLPQTNLPPGEVVYPSWSPSSGFKVSAGSYLDYDLWDISIEYTWFKHKDTTFSSFVSKGQGNFPLFFPANFQGVADGAGSLWNNQFNRVNLDLGRDCYLGERFSCRPSFGLTGAWEQQSFIVEYITSATPIPTVYKVNNHQRWWSVGPYAGYKSAFILVYAEDFEFSLFVDAGAALPWGRYKTNSTSSDNSGNLYFDGGGTFWNMDPMIEIALGLRMEAFLSPAGPWSLLAQIGWEQATWFGHNRMVLWNITHSTNDYSTQGLTVKAEVGF